MGKSLAGGSEGREKIGKRRSARDAMESRQTARWEKCDLGCPITTPWQNTADKTRAEWERQRGRQGEEDRVKGGKVGGETSSRGERV